jgi:hypothetical protein
LNHFESNLALLAVSQPELAQKLRRTQCKRVKIFASASGLPTACYERESASLALHSRYNPLKEARHTFSKHICEGTDYFIFLGFGLGYLLDAVLEEDTDPSNSFFVVESDLEILTAAFEARDLSHIFSNARVHFAWPVTGPELAEQWQQFFDPVHAQKSAFLTHLPSVALNAELFKSAAKLIQSQTFQIFTDINTLINQSQTFLDNFTQNIVRAVRSPGVLRFAGLFAGTPAVIVSAGPSLDKNIHELRGCEERILILSTDTALKPLLAAGIEPHFVMTGDPSYTNYRHLKNAAAGNAFLVAEATSFPEVFVEFEGRTLTCIYENSSLRSLTDLLGKKGMLRAWGSVATMALDFALLLRCNPIAFIGQDLAYTDGRTYCSGLCFDDEWFAGLTNPSEWQAQLKAMRSWHRTIAAEDIYGQPVESTDKLVSYWNWLLKVFRDHPEVHFINASEGGILRDHVTIASLKELLHRYCGKARDFRSIIRRTHAGTSGCSFRSVETNLYDYIQEMTAIRDILNQGNRLCETRNGYSSNELIKKLESIKESIYGNSRLAPLLDCLNQMGNITFLRRLRGASKVSNITALAPAMQAIYSEYFTSVSHALSKVSDTLDRIAADIHSSGKQSSPFKSR